MKVVVADDGNVSRKLEKENLEKKKMSVCEPRKRDIF